MSYAFWVPGITLVLYTYEQKDALDITVKNENLISTLNLLQNMGATFAVFLVGFFGIGVPIVKLIVGVLAWRMDSPLPKSVLAKVSKWAILDAIACCIIMALFMGRTARPWAYVGTGFNFFVIYCLLSTYAATLIDRPYSISEKVTLHRLFAAPFVSVATLTMCLMLTMISFLEPVYSISLQGTVSLSMITALARLTSYSSISDGRPAALLLIFVVILPVLETLYMAYLVFFPQDTKIAKRLLQVLPEFCLYEVFTVTLPVMIFFVNGVGDLGFELTPHSYLLYVLASALKIVARYAVPQYLAIAVQNRSSSQSNLQADPVSCPTVIIVSSDKAKEAMYV